MATSAQTRPEPMNSSPHHSKMKVSMTLADATFVAGTFVAGKMEMECRADHGLGISIMMVELFAVQELTSRDHSATSTFLHSRRLFQGPGLPPSNAVQAYPQPGDPSYPLDYYQARRGISKFLFRIPLPSSAPSSISFGGDLARVRYELRATVGVVWKGEKRLVVCKREIDVVESYELDFSRTEPETVVVGEYGKIWAHGRVVGGAIIAGESACVELQVKNHSAKKNTGLTLALTRTLVLPGLKPGEISPLEISDVLATVSFRGLEYIIPPGAEGVASLVFDVPKHARGVRGGMLEGGESEHRTSQSIFEVRCILGITISMGLGTKDIHLDIPVPIVHPMALPDLTDYAATSYNNVYSPPDLIPSPHVMPTSYVQPIHPMPPIPAAYVDLAQNQIWLPPPSSHTPHINDLQYFSPPVAIEGTEPQYYFPPPPHVHITSFIPARPMSAEPTPSDYFSSNAAGMNAGPASPLVSQHLLVPFSNTEPEEGKGERASRVTQHLRLTSRHRSVSPRSHRFPLPVPPTGAVQLLPSASSSSTEQMGMSHLRNIPPAPLLTAAPIPAGEPLVHSPRPFLSPKRSFNNSLPKSERVEELERMAEEVEKTTLDLSSDLPKNIPELQDANPSGAITPTEVEGTPPAETDINKTLPVPPPPTKKSKGKGPAKASARTRIDEFFANSPSITTETKTPPTPLAAVTPVKLPSKPKSAEFRAQMQMNGPAESGLDALEKRLLAEVGTRKADVPNDRRPAWSVVGVQPINIPSKEVLPDDALNDSAISSLTLAGERMGDRDEMDLDGAMELDGEHDSDEKTHRAGKSNASAGSRRGSKGKVEKTKKKGKKKDKDKAEKDGDVPHVKTRKKAEAAKGRVAAWLGGIEPEVPPVEQVLPPSPSVSRKPAPFMEDSSSTDNPAASLVAHADEVKGSSDAGASAPNPRSSGFVPIGTFKSGTLLRPFKPLARDATVVQDAKRVADMWSSSVWASNVASAPKDSVVSDEPLPVLKDLSPATPSVVPSTVTTQPARVDRKLSPPSTIRVLGTNAARTPQVNLRLPTLKAAQQPSVPAMPLSSIQPDPEVTYDVRSARGGRGGRVAAITSIWATGAAGPNSKSIPEKVTPKPVRKLADPVAKDTAVIDSTPVTPKIPSRAPVKSLLTASAPQTLPPNSAKATDITNKHPRPVVKSPSVPAIISSSHATPTLSSTASLARPPPVKPRTLPVKLPLTVSETIARPDARRVPAQVLAKAPTKLESKSGDMAFGQARLRDLIKKYQGQAT